MKLNFETLLREYGNVAASVLEKSAVASTQGHPDVQRMILLRGLLQTALDADPDEERITAVLQIDRRVYLARPHWANAVDRGSIDLLKTVTGSHGDLWWWRSDQSPTAVENGLRWVCVLVLALSLALLIEIFSRFFLSGNDLLALVVQSLIGLVAGASAWQIAQSTLSRGGKTWGPQGWHLAIPALAIVLYFSLGTVADSYVKGGDRALAHHDLSTALERYKLADRLVPSDRTSLKLAEAYVELGDYGAAEKFYRSTIIQNPSQFAAYNNLSRSLILEKKRPDLALALLEDARPLITNKRKTAFLMKNRAWALVELNLFKAALKEIESISALNSGAPLDGALECLSALSYDGLNNQPQAKAAWTGCHKLAAAGAIHIEAKWAATALERQL